MKLYSQAALRKEHLTPVHAEGHICITLTDPISGKITEQVKGPNTVFTDSLISGIGKDWVNTVSKATLELTDSVSPIDPNCPYVLGNTIGFGTPSAAASGGYQGAYNAANQVLAQISMDKIHYKFQYDFTTAQANGTIGTIGLTHQHFGVSKETIEGFKLPQSIGTTGVYHTCDGRYVYYFNSTRNQITKYDLFLGVSSSIDASPTVASLHQVCAVGYSDSDKLWYIFGYSEATYRRSVYVFADNTFSNPIKIYTPTNMEEPNMGMECPTFVYGNYYFALYSNSVYCFDFVNNTDERRIVIPKGTGVFPNATMELSASNLNSGKYIFAMGHGTASRSNGGIVFDMSRKAAVATMVSPVSGKSAAMKHPIASNFLPCIASDNTLMNNTAIAAKALSAPITKTPSNGMTATYELDVFW